MTVLAGAPSLFIPSFAPLSPELQAQLLHTVVVIVALWLLYAAAARGINWGFKNPAVRYAWRRFVRYTILLIGLLLIGREWIQGVAALTTFLGLAAAGIAIALRDVLVGIAGWLYIVVRRPFGAGDRIQIGDAKGDVIDIHVLAVTLMEVGNWVDADQSTGRLLHVPTNRVVVEPVANYTREFPYVWHETAITLTFESNWRKAKGILQEILDRHTAGVTEQAARDLEEVSRRHFIVFSKLTPIVYTRLDENGIRLTMRLLCPPRKRRSLTQAVTEDMLDRFADCPDIHFAHPTLRLYGGMPTPDRSGVPSEAYEEMVRPG